PRPRLSLPDRAGLPHAGLGQEPAARHRALPVRERPLRRPVGARGGAAADPAAPAAEGEPVAMPDVLLTHGYFLHEDEKEQQIMKPYPPLGLLYISAYLKQKGFDVEVFDTTFATRADLVKRLGEGRGVVGVYTNLMTRSSVLDIARAAHERGWTVVLGGPEG